MAAECEQLSVRAAFDDLGVVEYEYEVGTANRAEPVRHDETRPAFQQYVQCPLKPCFGQ